MLKKPIPNTIQKKTNLARSDFFILLALMIGFGLFSVIRGQDANWDLRNYHYYNAYALLHGLFLRDIAPAFLQTYYNPLLDIFNYFIIHIIQAPKIIAFVMGSFSGITVFFLIKIARLLFFNATPLTHKGYLIIAIAIAISGAAGRSQLGNFMNEWQISIFVMTALYCILSGLYLQKTIQKQYAYLLAAGLFMGLGTGLKLTAATYACALLITAILACRRPFITHIKLCILLFCGIALGFLITEGFWMFKLYNAFGNPFFPYYNNIFHAPNANIASYADKRFLPKTLLQYCFFPFYWLRKNTLAGEGGFRDAHFALVFLFTVIFIVRTLFFWRAAPKTKNIFSAPQNAVANFILIFWFIAYLLWLTKFSIMRYTIPLELLSGLLITYFCITLFKSTRTRAIILSSITILLFSTTLLPSWHHVPFQSSFIRVQTPHIEKKSLVILMGERPVAYMIPYFPADTTFVRISTHFASDQLNIKPAHETIAHHNGPLYGLYNPDTQIADYLKQEHLIAQSHNCTLIRSNLDPAPVLFCPLKRRIDFNR